MAIQGYELTAGGVVLVDTVTGQPLPFSVRAFDDLEDADAFMSWLGCDVRRLEPCYYDRTLADWRAFKRQTEAA